MGFKILIGIDRASDIEELTRTLEIKLKLEVAGAIGVASTLLTAVETFQPEAVVLRLDGVTKAWLDAVLELSRAHKSIGVVALTDASEINDILSMLKAGVKSIIPLQPHPDDLETAIREASNGKIFIPTRRMNGV